MAPEQKPPNRDQTVARATAFEMGRVYAEIYLALGHSVRQTMRARRRIRSKGLKLWETIPAEERYQFLERNHSLVLEGFRQALTGELRNQAQKLLGFSAKDLRHIAEVSPGNPDISGSVGGVGTPNGNALVGPTVTVKDGSTEVTFGGGPEVDYKAAKDDILAGEGLKQATKESVKGGGIWVSIKIEFC